MALPLEKRNPEPPEIRLLRTVCASRGWRGWSVLAERAGCKSGSITTAIATNFARFPRLKLAIEGPGLDFSVPIWSTPDDLIQRKRIFDTTGVDPFLAGRGQLESLARRLRVNLGGRTRALADLRQALIVHATLNRNLGIE